MFAWAVLKSDLTDQKFLRIEYRDGRIMEVGLNHIVKANYYPLSWARLMGLENPYVDLSIMGRDTRLDFLKEGDAMELYEQMTGDGDEVIYKSENYGKKESG